jgi:competence protein ComEC
LRPVIAMTMRLLLTGFVTGTLLLQCCAVLPAATPLLVVVIVCALAARRLRRPREISWILAFVAACASGLALATLRAEVRLADALPHAFEGANLVVRGVVDDLPAQSDEGVRFVLRVEAVETPAAVVPSKLSLGWYRREVGDEPPLVHAGERWRLCVRLKRPHGTLNFAGFDLEAWLFERGLRATGVVRDDTANAHLADFSGNLLDWVGVAREHLRARIERALGERPYRGVIAALAIGDQQSIPQEQWRVFNRTGVSHLISISGLHITVFAALIGGAAYRLCRRWPRLTSRVPARRVAAVIGFTAAALYTFLAGAEVPALRTLIMLAVATLGLLLARPGTASIVWLWALAVVLLVDPWAGIAPGFWLSFGAVGLLLYAGSGRLAPVQPEGMVPRWRESLREGVHAQWVVTLGLAPGTLALFQQLSLIAPLANAVAIPVVTFAVVPLALAAIVIPVDGLFIAAYVVLEPLMHFLNALSEWPQAAWQQHSPEPWSVAVAMVGVLWLLAPRGVPGRWLGVAWLLPLFVITPPVPAPGTFDLTALDVGQGLSVLVRTHEHRMLFDTGPRFNETTDAGSRIIVPALRAAGAGALDLLVVSHADSDHSGGALSVIDMLPVTALLSSLEPDNAIVQRWGPSRAIRCRRGQHWTWDGVAFSVLHPTGDEYDDPSSKTNDRSCVVRIEGEGLTALLTGDIEARDERTLLAANLPLAADVLVVPHHGSRTSSTVPFVAAVAPRIAIFTAGYRNRFDHPRPEVVLRYRALDSLLLRSDTDGAVRVQTLADRLELSTARRERRRYWHDSADD